MKFQKRQVPETRSFFVVVFFCFFLFFFSDSFKRNWDMNNDLTFSANNYSSCVIIDILSNERVE